MPPKKSKTARVVKKKTAAPRQIVISSESSDDEAISQKQTKISPPKDNPVLTPKDHPLSPKPQTDLSNKKKKVISRRPIPESTPQSPEGVPSEGKRKLSQSLNQNTGSRAQNTVSAPLPHQQNVPTPLPDESTTNQKQKKVSRARKRQRGSHLEEDEQVIKKVKLPKPKKDAPSSQVPERPTDLQTQEDISTRRSQLQMSNASPQVQEGDSSTDPEGQHANLKEKKILPLVKRAPNSELQEEVAGPQIHTPIPDLQPDQHATIPQLQQPKLSPQHQEKDPSPQIPNHGVLLRSCDYNLSQSQEHVLDFPTGRQFSIHQPSEDESRLHSGEHAASPRLSARVLSLYNLASRPNSREFIPALVLDDLASMDEPCAEAAAVPFAAEPNATQEAPYSPHLGMTPPINPKSEPESQEAALLADASLQEPETSTPEHDAIPPITTVDMVRHTSDFLPTTHQLTVTTTLRTKFTLPNFTEPHPRSSKRIGDEGVRFALDALDMERKKDRLASVILERAVLLKIRSSEAVLRLENEIEERLQERLEQDYPGITEVLNESDGTHTLATEENSTLAQGNPRDHVSGFIAGGREQPTGGYYEEEDAHDRFHIHNGKSRADAYGQDLQTHDLSHRKTPTEHRGQYAQGYGFGEAVTDNKQHEGNYKGLAMDPQEARRTLIHQPSGLFYGHGYGGGATGIGEVQEEDRSYRDAVQKEGRHYQRSSNVHGKSEEPEAQAVDSYL